MYVIYLAIVREILPINFLAIDHRPIVGPVISG